MTVMIPQAQYSVRCLERGDAFFSLKQMCNEVAEWSAGLGTQSLQQLKIVAMPFDERKTFAATKEDLEQNTADVPVVMQRQVLVIQKAQRTVDVQMLASVH